MTPVIDTETIDTSSSRAGSSAPRQAHGVAAYALDPDSAARLWDVSLDLLGRPAELD